MIAIIDYKMGNLFSILNGLRKAGGDAEIVGDPSKLGNATGIVMPGVGAFGDGMRNLKPFADRIKELLGSIPMLGICLGMQIMFEQSEESRERGMGLIKGEVKLLPRGVRIPQMGWNSIRIRGDGIFEGIPDGCYFYFAHSYRCIPSEDVVIATIDYGEEVVAAIRKGMIYGVQFHPEKSGKVGTRLLENFVRICKS
mgnify:CR=1 FL=1